MRMSGPARMARPRLWERKPPPDVTAHETLIAAVPVRTYRTPTPSSRAVIYLHGGDFLDGDLDTSDHICRALAHLTNDRVLSVGYRLATEDPFPAALDDGDFVIQYALASSEFTTVSVAGDGAGGNLAAGLALRYRSWLAHQVLLCPILDLTCARKSWQSEASTPRERERAFEHFARYVGGHERTDPLVSPMFEEKLTDLPPALVVTAQRDTWRDDGRDYARRLRDADVPTRYTEYAGMPHDFLLSARTERAFDHCLLEVSNFLKGIS